MTEENLKPEVEGGEKCKCFCHSKGFRKFLITALGTFVGVYCALALFTAIHRPPMMPPCPMMPRMAVGCPCMHHHFKKPMDMESDKMFPGDGHARKHMNNDRAKFDEHEKVDD